MKSHYDRRIERTRQRLRKELAKLLEKKSVNCITVKELCEAADINRSTFYLHYQDIPDMVVKIEQEIYDDYQLTLQRYVVEERGWLEGLSQKQANSEMTILLETFRFIKKNRDVTQFFLSEISDSHFLRSLFDSGKERFLEQVQDNGPVVPERLLRYYYDFVASGCLGLILSWVREGLQETPEEMSYMAQQVIRYGQSLLQREIFIPSKKSV